VTGYKLGRLPATRPHGLRDLAVYATGPLPAPPEAVAVPKASYPMDGNSQFGDCLAEGTLVQASGATGGLRAPYSGPVVRLGFESGKHLTVTPDHAILTPRGFVPARLLQEGDYAVSARSGEVGRLGLKQDLNETPAPVEDVFAALLRSGARASQGSQGRMVVDSVGLDGYEAFLKGKVEVVWPYGLLKHEVSQAALRQLDRQEQIGHARQAQGPLHRRRPLLQGPVVGALAALGYVRGQRHSLAVLLAHRGVPQGLGFGLAVAGYPGFIEQRSEPALTHSRLPREGHRRLTSDVSLEKWAHIGIAPAPVESGGLAGSSNQVASARKPTAESGPTDPQLPSNLRNRFPGLVEEDRLVEVNWDWFSGHIYDLSTPVHWYLSNGIITHNCVMAGVAHLDSAWDAEVEAPDPIPDESQVVSTYFQLTGGQDTGLNEATVLQIWRTQGLFGRKIAAYAPVDPRDITELHQAVAFYGGSMLGITCPVSAQQQFAAGDPWTFVPDSQIAGGHAIVALGYTPTALLCATWGGIAQVTYPFLAHYLDEAWAIVPSQFVEAGRGPRMDLATLQADLDRV
jgi:hypothetical protein